MSRLSSNRADRLPAVHHIPSAFLLTRVSSPVHVHAFVSDSRVENKQICQAREINRKILLCSTHDLSQSCQSTYWSLEVSSAALERV